MKRLKRMAAAISEFFNAAIGGHNNESLSGRAWRTQSRWYRVINKIFFWEENHCKAAHLDDVTWAVAFLNEVENGISKVR